MISQHCIILYFYFTVVFIFCQLQVVSSFVPLLVSTKQTIGTGARLHYNEPVPSLLYSTTAVVDNEATLFLSEQEQTHVRIDTLKKELIQLGDQTNRGFVANSEDRKKAKRIISELKTLNPTKEPARSYYDDKDINKNQKPQLLNDGTDSVSIQGKWTLLYTDAPDITTLDRNPFATLGRIGQECSPPYIKNVIEYTRPSWLSNLPFPGNENSRVLQKVVVKASATSTNPSKVNLLLSGIQIETDDNNSSINNNNNNNNNSNYIYNESDQFGSQQQKIASSTVFDRIQENGLIVGLLQNNPVDINGPIDAPFGEFEILYLDEEFRIIKTGQNYYAVNIRQTPGNEWF